MNLEISTRAGVVYRDEVDMVILPAWEGQMGVLDSHADFIVMLRSGPLTARKGGRAEMISISSGYAEVSGNRVVVLPDAVYEVKKAPESLQ